MNNSTELRGIAAALEVGGVSIDSAANAIRNASSEIERLNAHVAMLREVISDAYQDVSISKSVANTLSPVANSIHIEVAVWIATHDAKVRDDALEEAAIICDRHSGASACECPETAESCRDKIRAVKGTK